MDIQALKNYLDCDNTFLQNLVKTFIEEATEITKRIELAWQNENPKSIKLNAHKLLSSARILELADLTAILETIEKCSITKPNSKELKVQISLLGNCIQKVIDDMNITLEELNS